MSFNARYLAFAFGGIIATALSIGAHAQFIPPAGYSGNGKPPRAAVLPDPDAPPLITISNSVASDLITVNSSYLRGSSKAQAKVVGAYVIAETSKRRVLAAWSPGFLPVTLSFSDGQCYSLRADYYGGVLSNGRLNKVGCEGPRKFYEVAVAPPPPGRPLKLIGTAWGYGAWADRKAGTTIITAPGAHTFQPLFTARMTSTAIMAMNGPDWPGGNVTLVGEVRGKLTVLTLEVGY